MRDTQYAHKERLHILSTAFEMLGFTLTEAATPLINTMNRSPAKYEKYEVKYSQVLRNASPSIFFTVNSLLILCAVSPTLLSASPPNDSICSENIPSADFSSSFLPSSATHTRNGSDAKNTVRAAAKKRILLIMTVCPLHSTQCS